MYNVLFTSKDFNTVILEDRQNRASASVAVERGGILTGYEADGIEAIYLDRGTFYDVDTSVRGGCPILFPICGRLEERKYRVGDKVYTMEIHGFARILPWRVLNFDTSDAATLTIALESTAETKRLYPFDFRLEYTYILKDGRLKIRQETHNTSIKDDMPMSFGLHPYFNIKRELARVYLPAGRKITNTNTDDDFDGVGGFNGFTEYIVEKTSDKPAILDTGLGYGVSLSCSGEYRYYVVWSPEDMRFACVEPWTARPNALNTKESLIRLLPGEHIAADIEMCITK